MRKLSLLIVLACLTGCADPAPTTLSLNTDVRLTQEDEKAMVHMSGEEVAAYLTGKYGKHDAYVLMSRLRTEAQLLGYN